LAGGEATGDSTEKILAITMTRKYIQPVCAGTFRSRNGKVACGIHYYQRGIKVYTQIYILRFPKDTSDQPFIYRLVKEYDIEFNILKADILLQREGIMIIELKGSSKTNVKAGLDYLRGMGVKIERLAARIRRDDKNCFQCGACTGVCSSGALYIQRPEMAVIFDAEKCTGCSLCVPICPVRAMAVSLNGDWIFSEKFMV